MKPFNLDIILKRSRHFYKKSTPKAIKIKAFIPAGQATKQPPLGSILGTYGLNAEQFCLVYNRQTQYFSVPIKLPNIISILPNKSFLITTKNPTSYDLWSLVKKSINHMKKFLRSYKLILLILFYKIKLIKSSFYKQILLSSLISQHYSYDVFDQAAEDKKFKNFRRKKK
jgi:hypothetical protein